MSQNEQPRELMNNCIDWMKRIFCFTVYDFSNFSETDINKVLQIRQIICFIFFGLGFALFWLAVYQITIVIEDRTITASLIVTLCSTMASCFLSVYLSGTRQPIQPLRVSRPPLAKAPRELFSTQRNKLSPIKEVTERSSSPASGQNFQLPIITVHQSPVSSISVSQEKEVRSESESDAATKISKPIESSNTALSRTNPPPSCDVPPDDQAPSTSGLQATAAVGKICDSV